MLTSRGKAKQHAVPQRPLFVISWFPSPIHRCRDAAAAAADDDDDDNGDNDDDDNTGISGFRDEIRLRNRLVTQGLEK